MADAPFRDLAKLQEQGFYASEAAFARVREFACQPKLIDEKPAAPVPQELPL